MLTFFKDYIRSSSTVKRQSISYFAMGLMDKLSVWLGGGRVEATVLLLGLDNSGKSSLLQALRTADPPPANEQDLFTGIWPSSLTYLFQVMCFKWQDSYLPFTA